VGQREPLAEEGWRARSYLMNLATSHRISSWAHAGELLYLLVIKDLKVRYKSRFLGYVWALANPLAFAFMYWLAFKFIMRMDMANYSLFLITGIFPWIWLSTGAVNGARSFVYNASLIRKANLWRPILPLSCVVQETVHFLFALPVIAAFLFFTGDLPLRASWLWQIPLLIALQVAFAYPIALSLAVTSVYVRDIEFLVGIGFSLLFFATPMVYPITMVPEEYRGWFELNPLHALIDSWRSVLLEGAVQPQHLGYAAATAAAMGVIAWVLYRWLVRRVGELI
jgi:lipopolysaccharide transport system permease protein